MSFFRGLCGPYIWRLGATVPRTLNSRTGSVATESLACARVKSAAPEISPLSRSLIGATQRIRRSDGSGIGSGKRQF